MSPPGRGIRMIRDPHGFKEPVTDEQLVFLIHEEVSASVGNFLGSSELTEEREKATYEYAMQPFGHLKPQGVSKIVSSDTVEAIEGYSAVLSELLLNNKKLAKFIPVSSNPKDVHQARVASDLVNYCIFKKNRGWELLNTWIKATLLWKNGSIVWEYQEDYDYRHEEFDLITPEALDLLLSDPEVEIIGDLFINDAGSYEDVRIQRKVNKSGIKIRNIEPGSFLISANATSIEDAAFVGLETEMTRSDIRKMYPEQAAKIDWDTVEETRSFIQALNTDEASRKFVLGLSVTDRITQPPSESAQLARVIECWIRIDRDGDGIAELKRIILVGDNIIVEEDVDEIQVADIKIFEIPHEWAGLSMADMTRPATLASTAIIRGFVENTYLTNYAPKLADPNVVDFSALQNIKPKQIIATNGNPALAVHPMPPETISTGTIPLLEFLQSHKEQANGLSKAAQGLNDTLYVSGNSEQKVARVQTAAQTRIQHIARRIMETGFSRLCEGIYKTMLREMKGQNVSYYTSNDFYKTINIDDLPSDMMMTVEADVGDASNQTVLSKMQIIGQTVLPALIEAGAGGIVNPAAAGTIAFKTIEALGEDPLDYIVDYTTDEFKKAAGENRKRDQEESQRARELEQEKIATDLELNKANVSYTNVQSQNAIQDNLKQLMVAMDKSYQEWAKLTISAGKENQQLPEPPVVQDIYAEASMLIAQTMTAPDSEVRSESNTNGPQGTQRPNQGGVGA